MKRARHCSAPGSPKRPTICEAPSSSVRLTDAPLDIAIYHCQQTSEKAVKAFLVSKELSPEKTHDIRRLTLAAAAHEPRFHELLDMAAALTPYAWAFRYPGELAETYPTREEFDEALRHAQAIYDFVVNLLPTEAHP